MNCPLLEELTTNHPHLETCDTCLALISLRDGSRPDSAACDDIASLLPLYSEAILDADDQALVSDHLSGCPACTRSILGHEVGQQAASDAWASPQDLGDELDHRRSRIPIAVSLLVVAAAALVLLRWQPWKEDIANRSTVARDTVGNESVDSGHTTAGGIKPPILDAGPSDASALPLEPRAENISTVLARAQSAIEKCIETHHSQWHDPTVQSENFMIQRDGKTIIYPWSRVGPPSEFSECVTEQLLFEGSQHGGSLACTFQYRASKAGYRCKPGSVARPIQPSLRHITSVIDEALPAFDACHAASHSKDPGRPGPWQYSMRVSPGGQIANLHERSPQYLSWGRTRPSPEFQACVLSVLKTLRFDASEQGVELRCTFKRVEQRRFARRSHSCRIQ